MKVLSFEISKGAGIASGLIVPILMLIFLSPVALAMSDERFPPIVKPEKQPWEESASTAHATPPIEAEAPAEQPLEEPKAYYSPDERLWELFRGIIDSYPQSLDDARLWFIQKSTEISVQDLLQSGISERKLLGTPLWPDIRRLKALEPRFGDMPEYWQGMYLFDVEKAWSERIKHLQKALNAAPNDPVSKFFLAREKALQAREEWSNSNGSLDAYQHKRQTFLESADIMADVGGSTGNAFCFYESARLLSELGEYQRVTELLKKGNDAPANFKIEPFPLTFIKQRISEIRTEDGSKGKFRLLAFLAMNQPVEDYVRLKVMMREYQVIISLSGNKELLNVIHRFTCKFGQQKYTGLMEQMVGAALTAMAQATYEELSSDTWTKRQHRAFLQLDRYRQAVRGYFRGISLARDFERMKQGKSANELVDATPEVYWDYFINWWLEQEFYQKHLYQYIESNFRKMGEFDFTNPEGYIYLWD